MSKNKTNNPNDKATAENIFQNVTKDSIIYANGDTLNSFGLDLTNPDLIKFEEGSIQIEIIGGVTDVSLHQLKVSLKIQKIHGNSAMEVYRAQSVDLFNTNQLEYTITQASERTRIESEKMRSVLYALVQKLDDYKRSKIYAVPEDKAPKVSNKVIKDVKDFLKAPDLLENIKILLERSGVPDTNLGLKLFILNLSRLTQNPLHTIIQGNILLSHEVCKQFGTLIPEEDIKLLTSISKNVLSYSPYPNYWNKKLLVLHQLEGALNQKDSMLEEYMRNDHLNRYVTEVNHISGKYQMGQKSVYEPFSILGYTSKDFHKVFSSSSVVCLPLCNTKQIKDKLNEWELKKHAGLINENEVQNSVQILHHIQRLIELNIKIINPYIDQIDFQKFFDNDVKKIKQFMQLTNIVTMLHRFQLNPKKKDEQIYFEVQPEHILTVLELFKELWVADYDELYFQVLCTLKQIKTVVKKDNPDNCEDAMFTERDIQPKLKISPATLNRHINKLVLYNKLERVHGNNRTGFYYSVKSWSENKADKDRLQEFKNEIMNLINSEVNHEATPDAQRA